MAGDFDYGILGQVTHRQWPMPSRPWLMTQTWHDLLFAHWPVDRALLRRQVPEPFELDAWGGEYWLGIVPFHMTNVAPRGLPAVPWLSAFPELNVRTYVRVGSRAGVYFLSLDAGRRAAVAAARALLNLPYFPAAMRVERRVTAVAYDSRRMQAGPAAILQTTYCRRGMPFNAASDSLEHFLTERYCLYNVDRRGRPYRLDIHHPPWRLEQADATFERNTMGDVAGITLARTTAPLLHFAERQDMVAWSPAPIR